MKHIICVWSFLFGAVVSAQISSTAQMPAAGSSHARADKIFKADEKITDFRIKADWGSMSRTSAIFSLNYLGPPVGDVTAENQPNPDRSVGNYATTLGGMMAVRYRLDSQSAINFGTGLNSVAPFHDDRRVDLRNPHLGIDRVFHFGDWQTRQALGGSLKTIPEYRAVGEVVGAHYTSTTYHALGSSRFLAGADVALFDSIYDRRYQRSDRNAARFNLAMYPTLKYKASDHFSAYVSYSLAFWNPRFADSSAALWMKIPSQRLGCEYALTRDIYFAPYLNFYAQNFAWETTTINFATVFSVL